MTAMDTFIRGKIHPFDRLYSRREIYTGTPAKMMAFAILLFGLGLLGYSAVEFASPGKAARNVKDLLNTPHWGRSNPVDLRFLHALVWHHPIDRWKRPPHGTAQFAGGFWFSGRRTDHGTTAEILLAAGSLMILHPEVLAGMTT